MLTDAKHYAHPNFTCQSDDISNIIFSSVIHICLPYGGQARGKPCLPLAKYEKILTGREQP
jgi:hypothetical protein